MPLCKKYGAAVVGLCLDGDGIPETCEGRLEIAGRILSAALAHGIPRDDVYIDCLTLTVSAQQNQAVETLRAVRAVREELGLHTVLGVSNISFGLPERENVTVSFLTAAMQAGLDLPIVNPNQQRVMDAIASFRVLSGQDRDCADYLLRFAPGSASSAGSASVGSHQSSAASSGASGSQAGPVSASGHAMSLQEAILRGLKAETRELTEKALEEMDELSVVNNLLNPALDLVGERYEKQEIFLPQLINSANAACTGFELIRDRISAKGGNSVSKGKIILATVFGDIHDIGKNIVRVVLENYGYTVIDLGRDVPVETVVDAAIREDIRLVGLSALMTTTLKGMEETIKLLREHHPCKVMVGGAVLTPDYAKQIGADFYAKDAKQSCDIAKEVFGQ